MLDADSCYRALSARDPRFDGMFFVAVETTGIYCRPVCTARRPGRARVRFFETAVEAEHAGFRACLRCRPELAPGRAPLDSIPRLVRAAVAWIDRGYLDEHTLGELAGVLGVSGRHLRRALVEQLGVTPIQLVQSRRYATAKRLLTETDLSMTAVAHASGYRSLRRFNAAFAARHGSAPSSIRKGPSPTRSDALTLRLDYRPPLDWDGLLAFFGARAVAGVETVHDGVYRRTLQLGDRGGVLCVRKDPRRAALLVTLPTALAVKTPIIVSRLRALFDLDAEPHAISDCLGKDPLLGPLLERRPGLRVAGGFDPFEAMARAVLGQQVSVRGATTRVGRLVERFGHRLAAEDDPDEGLSNVFPSAEQVAAVDPTELRSLGIPMKRAEALSAVARLAAAGAVDRAHVAGRLVERLVAIAGIGSFTAEYIAMRAFGYPDAFVARDLWVRRALGNVSETGARERAEAWRPWRAYAVMHLWASRVKG